MVLTDDCERLLFLEKHFIYIATDSSITQQRIYAEVFVYCLTALQRCSYLSSLSRFFLFSVSSIPTYIQVESSITSFGRLPLRSCYISGIVASVGTDWRRSFY